MLLTRHSMAIKIGSDCFLQLVVRRRLLKPQAQVVLQVLVELVTWKRHERGEIKSAHFNQAPPQNPPLLFVVFSPQCAVIQPKQRLLKAVTFWMLTCSWVLECTSQILLTSIFTDHVKKSPKCTSATTHKLYISGLQHGVSQPAKLRLARRC